MTLLVLLAALALATIWRRKAEHDQRLRDERQRFVPYSDRYAQDAEAEAIKAIEEWLRR